MGFSSATCTCSRLKGAIVPMSPTKQRLHLLKVQGCRMIQLSLIERKDKPHTVSITLWALASMMDP